MAGPLLSINRFPGDGSTTIWNINFAGGYINKEHVKGYIQDSTTLAVLQTLTFAPGDWIGPNQIKIVPAVASTEILTIYRDTPKNQPLVDFTDGAIFTEANLDKVLNQAVFVAAEAVDAIGTGAEDASDAATAAAGSAAAAATSAAGAASSQTAAAASYDSFDDRYLGPKTSDPTLDNDGAALLTGALYFNSTSGIMKVWGGSSWIPLPATVAAGIVNTPAGTISATNVQAALNELDSEKLAIVDFQSRAGTVGPLSGDRNRVINGSCQIVNVASVASVAGAPVYGGPELFAAFESTSAGGQFTQSQGSMTFGGLTLKTVRQTVNTAPTSLATGDYWFGIDQRLEGFNVFDLRGKPVTLSFVFNTNVSGTYSVVLRDGDGTQSYVTTITADANTPQQVSIPLAAIPSAAALPNTAEIGLRINVGGLNTGTFQTATVNQWQSGNFFTAAGATNWGATADNFIELTNLQLEEGTVATPFIRRSYQQELALTQRYAELVNVGFMAGLTQSASVAYVGTAFSVRKRSTPTLTFAALNQFLYTTAASSTNPTSLAMDNSSIDYIGIAVGGSFTAGQALRLISAGGGSTPTILASARL